MKLLDKPIEKTAALSNRDALAQALLSAGAGAGVGALAQRLITGKGGWTGAALGGAAGVGGNFALNDEFRDKVVSSLRPKRDVTKGTEMRQMARQPTQHELHQHYKDLLAGDYGLSDEEKGALQTVVTHWDNRQADIKTANELYASPEYRKIMEHGRVGSKFDVIRGANVPDVSAHMLRYASKYEQAEGERATPEHLYRFAEATRAGLKQEDWDRYRADKHDFSGLEEGSIYRELFPQLLAGKATSKIPKSLWNKLMPKATQRARQLRRAKRHGSTVLKNVGKATGGTGTGRLATMMLTRKHGAKKATQLLAQRAAAKQASKTLARKGMVRIGGKAMARSIPGVGALVDATELMFDPVTGKYDFDPRNIGRNIANYDRLMELRERHGNQYFTKNKRNAAYNVGMGGLRGLFNQATTLAVAGNRIKNIGGEAIDNVKRGGAKGAMKHLQSQAGAAASFIPFVGDQNWGMGHAAATDEEINEYRAKIGKPPLRSQR